MVPRLGGAVERRRQHMPHLVRQRPQQGAHQGLGHRAGVHQIGFLTLPVRRQDGTEGADQGVAM
ncbi:hypothetical protein HUT19_36575 [Streptomyces sp. NA02950]|uniref:hypothetical protein n=1 Tax=Streptomyces sp. NA02950 TaxID=2742137 RepID=UPI00158FC460|nr:hypothetical protein [Streptomyces sp. NA02950]QKV96534.1 hypothetical protein HUT19_36575 [Streptomyces sp. NA02950]